MMARLRFLAVTLFSLVLAGSPTQTGRSADDSAGSFDEARAAGAKIGAIRAKIAAMDDGSCVIYALTDMGYDSDLGKWIAQTVPEMIEPKSWQEQGGTGVLRYYAPKNILIVKNAAAIQTKVDGFLKDLKKSLPKGNESSAATGKKSPRASVVPADYRTPALLRTSSSVPEPSSYPVPAPAKPPKHLFHFLIRYEGDGIIDDNVVKFMKAYYQSEQGTLAAGKGSHAGNVCPPASTPSVSVAPAPPAAGAAVEANDRKEKEDKKDDEKGNLGKKP
jgi:hypothetical protein